MHSPRTCSASAIRPSSPLSPRFESSTRYQSLQTPSSRPFSPRGPTSTTQQRRQHGSHLALPGLPRFHPANFPSAHSPVANTPGSGPASPQAPLSPQTQHKMYTDAQKQALIYQREHLPRSSSQTSLRIKPASPRLEPLGSPGPVTPLELEEHENYLAAGSSSSGTYHSPSFPSTFDHSDELTAKLTQIARQSERSPRTLSSSSRAS